MAIGFDPVETAAQSKEELEKKSQWATCGKLHSMQK